MGLAEWRRQMKVTLSNVSEDQEWAPVRIDPQASSRSLDSCDNIARASIKRDVKADRLTPAYPRNEGVLI